MTDELNPPGIFPPITREINPLECLPRDPPKPTPRADPSSSRDLDKGISSTFFLSFWATMTANTSIALMGASSMTTEGEEDAGATTGVGDGIGDVGGATCDVDGSGEGASSAGDAGSSSN